MFGSDMEIIRFPELRDIAARATMNLLPNRNEEIHKKRVIYTWYNVYLHHARTLLTKRFCSHIFQLVK